MLNILRWPARLIRRRSGPHPADALDAFSPEEAAAPSQEPPPGRRMERRGWIATILLVLVALLGASGAYVFLKSPFAVEAAAATLAIESDPPGAEVHALGKLQGRTPLTLAVVPGEHTFDVVSEGRRRQVTTIARAGATMVHHVTFEPVETADPRPASLRIVTEPARLQVLLNGEPKGTSPLLLEDITPGEHLIRVVGTSGTLERAVDVQPGESASVIIATPVAAAGGSSAAGWLRVESPLSLQIQEGSDIIGTSQSSRLMLAAGRHELLLTNEAVGFSERRIVQIRAGGTATVRVEIPKAPLNINAVPWAEVWVDDRRIGETPIGNLMVPLGPHEVVFRHPELGERRMRVTVSLTRPARVSLDLRRPQ